jgi:hypothetical protein
VLALKSGTLPDFFIYRLGSVLAARGENPYDLAKVRAHVAAQFPDPEADQNSFVNNCGYFLPPQAVLLMSPFAMIPWDGAKLAWALLHGLAGFAIATLPRLLACSAPPAPGLVPRVVPFLLLLNFLTVAVVMVGQVTVVSVGCVVAGLWCFARDTRWSFWAGVLLWSVAFIKPHLALALVPLAWYLGGWKRAAALVAVVAVLNLVGAALVGGSPLFLRDYFGYLAENHRAVKLNRAELNFEMTSWNRLLFIATEALADKPFLIEQTALETGASYLVWFGLVLGRCAISGATPSATWALAATAAGAVFCPQVLGYEALWLVLAVPWVRDLFDGGRPTWGTAAVLLLGVQAALPIQMLGAIGIDFHRPLGAGLFALLVLLGPLRPPGADPDALT